MLQIVGGIAAGAAAMVLAPSIMSAAAEIAKPVTKTVIKGGMLAYESGKQLLQQSWSALAGAVETVEDLAAEARAEIAESRKQPAKTKTKKAA